MKLLPFVLFEIVFSVNQCFPDIKYPESCNYIEELSKETAICIQKYYDRGIICAENECQLETEEDNRTLNKSKSFYEIKCKLDKILSKKDDYILTKRIIEDNINLLNELKLSITNQNKDIEKYLNNNEIIKINKKITDIKKKKTFLIDFAGKIMYGLILILFFVILRLMINEIQIYFRYK